MPNTHPWNGIDEDGNPCYMGTAPPPALDHDDGMGIGGGAIVDFGPTAHPDGPPLPAAAARSIGTGDPEAAPSPEYWH